MVTRRVSKPGLLGLLLVIVCTASRGSVPPGTAINNQASASYAVASGPSTTANSNVVGLITQAATATLTLTKSASQTSAKPGDHPVFTLNVSNSGGADAAGVAVTIDGAAATKVVVIDAIPNNTQFAAIVNAGGATPLYRLYGSPAQTYVSVPPADLTTIEFVAFALNSLATGANATFSFSVTVDGNANGAIQNMAQVLFNNGSDTVAQSNTVDIQVAGPPPSLAYYLDGTFSRTILATDMGAPLWIQINAAACNLDPAAIETKAITLKSQLTGDTETYTATETGPNTGVFRVLPAVPTLSAATNPVVSGDKIMQVLVNDQVQATLTGCGASSVAVAILIDPAGTVFDSHSNVTLAGASVTLIDVTGGGNGGHPNAPATVFQFDGTTPAPSTVVTSANGQFQFPQVSPSTYRITVTPPANYTFPSAVSPAQLPSGRHIDPSASYNGPFTITATSATAVFDVPLDASSTTPMFVQKTAAQTQVELGDFVDYNVEIKNLLSTPLVNVQVTDHLPPGFIYQARSARLNAGPIADPPSKGPVLVFNIGTLAANADVNLSYRVLVGPGSSYGVAVNRAMAASGSAQSNSSSASVKVAGGVFSNQGFIVGKVFQDCNGNHIQDPGEAGVPGVRIYLEDGTFAITDGQGKYSIYGVQSRTHILKVDTYSLPPGTNLLAISSRNAGDGGSRFVDLQFGEMQKADFAIGNCTLEMAKEIEARRQKAGEEKELVRAMKAQFNVQEIQKDPSQLKAMPASGLVGTATASPQGGNAMRADPATAKDPAVPAPTIEPAAPTAAELASLTNELGFVDLHGNDVLPFAQTNVRIKGVAGNSFRLLVNGKEAPAKQVGTKSVLADKQLEVWEFVGVNLEPGRNTLLALQFDPWGNQRGAEEIVVVAPSKLGRLKIETRNKTYPADGKTPIKIAVSLTDASNVPVTVRTPITLEASNGAWMVKDLNPKESGTQVFIEGGKAEFDLMPPIQPGPSIVRVSSGGVSAESKIEFVPELRPMIAAGVVEYQLNFGGLAHNTVQPSLNDGFEQQLNLFSMQNADGSFGSSAHAALLLKGKIKGDNLLTLAYDSDKTSRNQLFRDIQPDQFYPVYGDASVRGFDAQSTSKAYLRIDHGTSYVVYGDFLTSDPSTTNSLSNYSRSMTGVQEHFSNNRVSLTGFASYDSLTQVVDELPANGTSGPFILSNPNGVGNSEKVEILTRDRNQPSVILDIRELTRFADYEFEPLSGQLLLKAPLPSLDSSLNLFSIRVTYEVNQGGERFWVGGGAGQVKLNNFMQVGGTFVNDANPADPNRLFGVNSKLALPDKTTFRAELAGTEHELEGLGFGYRLEMQHDDDKLKGKAYFSRTDQDFNNPTSIINKGRGEDGVKASYAIGHGMRVLGEFIRTEDVTIGGVQEGGNIALEKSLPGNIQTQFGFRHAEASAIPVSTAASGTTPNSLNTLESKISMPIPHFRRLTATADFEQDVSESDKRVLGFGANYQFWDRGRVYFRQEVISSLGDLYSLNPLQRRSATQIGVDTTYFKDAHVFSEYRIQDELNGRDAEAAIGLRNNWHIAKGLMGNTSMESVRSLNNVVNGTSVNSLALTGALEYTAHENWKASARTEWRGSTNGDSFLNTLGFAARLSDSWTFLGRNIWSDITTKSAIGTRHLQDRLQAGFALRDFQRNRWNALAMMELKHDNDNSQPANLVKTKIAIFSTTANYQITAPFTISGRYATKWNLDTSSGLSTSAATQLLGARGTWDLGKRWDVGLSASTLFSLAATSRQYEIGPEIGYRFISNMWISTGYNVAGFRDDDLSGENVTRRGAFVRMRFKFDENIFAPRAGSKP
jgi:uncharacterized repeat protein (TIGR01451 family)